MTLATLARYISIAAEYQLLRNIELQEQDPSRCSALLATDDMVINSKIFQSLDLLLADIENAVSAGQKNRSVNSHIKRLFRSNRAD